MKFCFNHAQLMEERCRRGMEGWEEERRRGGEEERRRGKG
jgi:hypothetical protein